METENNNPKNKKGMKLYKILFYISLFFAVVSFLPLIFGPKDATSLAFSVVGLTLFSGLLISAVLVFYYSHYTAKAALGSEQLAHWVFGKEEWQRFLENDFNLYVQHQRRNILMICGYAILCSSAALVFDFDSGLFVFIFLVVIISFFGTVAYFGSKTPFVASADPGGEVLINEQGVDVNGEKHDLSNWVDSVVLLDSYNPAMIEIKYSRYSGRYRHVRMARFPVPVGAKDLEAVLAKLKRLE